MGILEAIDRLDDQLHMAPAIPLTDQVRIDPDVLRASVGVIRREAGAIWGTDRSGPVGELFDALEELEAIVASAKPIPGAGQVRLNPHKAYEPLDRMRMRLAHAATRAGGTASPWAPVVDAIEAIDALMDTAGYALFSRALKIEARALRDAAARLRVTALQNLGPPDGHAGPKYSLYAAIDELDRLASGDGTVKVSHGELFGLVERMRAAALDGASK